MPDSPKPAKKWDYEVAKLNSRLEVGRIVAYGAVVLLCILAVALPLYMVQGIVKPFAGRKTDVHASVAITVGISISVVLNGLQWLKDRSQKRELRRLRRRAEELEREKAQSLEQA